jgi:hypothetical protein
MNSTRRFFPPVVAGPHFHDRRVPPMPMAESRSSFTP